MKTFLLTLVIFTFCTAGAMAAPLPGGDSRGGGV